MAASIFPHFPCIAPFREVNVIGRPLVSAPILARTAPNEVFCNSINLTEILGQEIISISESTSLAPVCSIIDNGNWNPSMSNHVLAMDLRQLLATVPISREDSVLWQDEALPSISYIWQ
ncbi:hypothetical protein POM88_054165 [Heracleum sosnowskyi]|uniref:Uncharacterized protein n=1 Tax=Heracleum sosnowskyi TaxID=360622 RepID=A0AAD8GN78_9APIA|nr:hypothetical protein POM88_054165 [Heracleum sosnowskyi]